MPVSLTKHIPPVSLYQSSKAPLLMCLCGVVEWRKNKLNLGNPPAGINVKVVGGQLVTQTVTIQKASVLTYNGISFQCSHGGESFNSVPTAFIIVYGKYFLLANYIYTQKTTSKFIILFSAVKSE